MDKIKFKDVNKLHWNELCDEYSIIRSTLNKLIRFSKSEREHIPRELPYIEKVHAYFQELNNTKLEKYKEAWEFQVKELSDAGEYFKNELLLLKNGEIFQ